MFVGVSDIEEAIVSLIAGGMFLEDPDKERNSERKARLAKDEENKKTKDLREETKRSKDLSSKNNKDRSHSKKNNNTNGKADNNSNDKGVTEIAGSNVWGRGKSFGGAVVGDEGLWDGKEGEGSVTERDRELRKAKLGHLTHLFEVPLEYLETFSIVNVVLQHKIEKQYVLRVTARFMVPKKIMFFFMKILIFQ